MNIIESLKRIRWRVSNGTYKPNQIDVDAVNFLCEWVTREKEKTILQNQLFAKLYTMYFSELLLHYQNINVAQKEINNQLSQPISNHVEVFRMRFNDCVMADFSAKIGLSKKHPMLLSDEENKKESEILQANQLEILEHINKYTFEQVGKSLENQITEAINNYKNL